MEIDISKYNLYFINRSKENFSQNEVNIISSMFNIKDDISFIISFGYDMYSYTITKLEDEYFLMHRITICSRSTLYKVYLFDQFDELMDSLTKIKNG